jgi:hypothetical protein
VTEGCSERGLEPNKATKKSVGLFFSLDMMPHCLPHSNSVIRIAFILSLSCTVQSYFSPIHLCYSRKKSTSLTHCIYCRLPSASVFIFGILFRRSGWSANKFRKSQSRKFADLPNLLYVRTDLPQVWQLADLRFGDPKFFAICGFAICGPNFLRN